MIHFVRADLFDLPADILINPVNCVGVMGKGIAREFRKRWPEMFEDYVLACRLGRVQPGMLYESQRGRWIINLPTKRHWRDKSSVLDVEAGLLALAVRLRKLDMLPVVAMPALGCGNGGLDWADVKPLIQKTLGRLANTIYVCEP